MRRDFVVAHEPVLFAAGQEKLPPEQRTTRTALPPEARWSCRQGRAKRPATGSLANMNLTNCKSN